MIRDTKGFTLIELLVVVGIIGILSTIAAVSFTGAQAKARDSKRIADIKSIQSALELYNGDVGTYPPSAAQILDNADKLSSGSGIAATATGNIYLNPVPAAASPKDGTCTQSAVPVVTDTNPFVYTSTTSDFATACPAPGPCAGYKVTFCLGEKVGNLAAGVHTATPAGIQ